MKKDFVLFHEGASLRSAPRLAFGQPATLATRRVLFAAYTPPRKTDGIFFAHMRKQMIPITSYKRGSLG